MGRGISAGTMGIALLAILAGLVGAYVVRFNLMKEPPAAVVAPESRIVPLATSDLPMGRTLALGDIGLTRLTPAEMEERGYDLTKTMLVAEQIIGRTLKDPVRQGQPFLTTAFYLEGTRRDFTADLKPGFRAVSLQLPRDRGGSLPSGSIVDVVFRSTEQKAEQGRLGIPEVTVRLLEGVEIIDVYDPPPPPAASRAAAGFDVRQFNVERRPTTPTVTLAVTPEQADIIQTTSDRGELTLVARPPDERVVASGKPKPLSLEDVLGIERPKPQQVVLFATEIYRRGSRSVNVYRDDKLVEQLRAEQTLPPVDDTTPTSDPTVPPTPMAPVPMPPTPEPPAPGARIPSTAPAPATPTPPAPSNDDPFAPDSPATPAPAPAAPQR